MCLGETNVFGENADMLEYLPPPTDKPLLVFVNNYHLSSIAGFLVEHLRDHYPIGSRIVTINPLPVRLVQLFPGSEHNHA